MNDLIENVKEDTTKWWTEYKILTRKPLMNCTLEELEKKRKRTKNLILSFLLTAILIWFVMMDLFIGGKTSITLNTAFLLVFIAFCSEIIENNQIQLFIYLKKKEKYPWMK